MFEVVSKRGFMAVAFRLDQLLLLRGVCTFFPKPRLGFGQKIGLPAGQDRLELAYRGANSLILPTYAWRGKLFVAASHLSLAPQVTLIWETNGSCCYRHRVLEKTPTCTQTEITEGIAADVAHGSGFSNLFRGPLIMRGMARYDLCTRLKGKAVCTHSPFFFRTMRTLQLIRQLRRPSPLETEWRPLGRLAMALWGTIDMPSFFLSCSKKLAINLFWPTLMLADGISGSN